MPQVELNGIKGFIPSENIATFAKENPEAIIHYQVDKNVAAIPAKNTESFLKDYPNAIGLGDEQEQNKPLTDMDKLRLGSFPAAPMNLSLQDKPAGQFLPPAKAKQPQIYNPAQRTEDTATLYNKEVENASAPDIRKEFVQAGESVNKGHGAQAEATTQSTNYLNNPQAQAEAQFDLINAAPTKYGVKNTDKVGNVSWDLMADNTEYMNGLFDQLPEQRQVEEWQKNPEKWNDRPFIQQFKTIADDQTGFLATGFGNTIEALNAGSAGVFGGLTEFIHQNIEKPLLGWLPENPNDRLAFGRLADYFFEAQAYSSSAAGKHNTIDENGQIRQKDFVDYFKEGDYARAFGDLGIGALESAPTSAVAIGATMAGAPQVGLGLIGAQVAGSRKRELDRNNPELSEFQKNLIAYGSGAIEAGSELLGDIPIGKMLGKIYKVGGTTVAENVMKNSVESIIEATTKQLKNGSILWKAPLSEGGEELASGVGNYLLDSAMGIQNFNFNEMMNQSAKQMAYGAVAGGGFGLVGAPGLIRNAKVASKLQALKSEYDTANSNMQAAFSDSEFEFDGERIITLPVEQQKQILASALQAENLTPEQKTAIQQYMKAGNSLNAALVNVGLTNIELLRKKANAVKQIENQTNEKTGTVDKITIQGTADTENYTLKSGTVVFDETGKVNPQESDEAIYYYTGATNEDGTPEVNIITPESISAIQSADPKQLLQQSFMDIEAEEFTRSEFGEGMQVQLNTNVGKVTGTVVAVTPTGLVVNAQGQEMEIPFVQAVQDVESVEQQQPTATANDFTTIPTEELSAQYESINAALESGALNEQQTSEAIAASEQIAAELEKRQQPADNGQQVAIPAGTEAVQPNGNKITVLAQNTDGSYQVDVEDTTGNITEQTMSEEEANNYFIAAVRPPAAEAVNTDTQAEGDRSMAVNADITDKNYPLLKDGTPDFDSMNDEQLFNYNLEQFGEEAAVKDLTDEITSLQKQIAAKEKSMSKAGMKERVKMRTEAKSMFDRLNVLNSLIPVKQEPENNEIAAVEQQPIITEQKIEQTAPTENTIKQVIPVLETQFPEGFTSQTDDRGRLNVSGSAADGYWLSIKENKDGTYLTMIGQKFKGMSNIEEMGTFFNDDLTAEQLPSIVDIVEADRKKFAEAQPVPTPKHTFSNFKEAEEWAKKNIVGIYTNVNTGEDITVSKNAISKYLSGKSVHKSVDKDAHLSALMQIPRLVETSVLRESKPDRDNNPDIKEIQLLEGIINYEGKNYPVKITVKAYQTGANKAYTYEVMKIESPVGNLSSHRTDTNPSTPDNQNSKTVSADKDNASNVENQINDVKNSTQAQLDTQALDAEIAAQSHNNTPTDKQKETGIYDKARISLQGYNITLETLKGEQRSGTDSNGKAWAITMNNHYGELDGTTGYDGDAIDVFVGPNPKSGQIFVVDQVTLDGTFDESKVMLGFDTAEEAKAAYMSNYEEGWQGFGNITPAGDNFKQWLYDGKKQRKPFSEYKDTPEAVDNGQLTVDNEENQADQLPDVGKMIEKPAEGDNVQFQSENQKQQQFDIIQKTNPMLDDYHTGIRSVSDIKTLEEAINIPEWDYDEYNPDYTKEMAEKAISTGKITIYSSNKIKNGVFVSPSKMEAESYSGNGKVYSREVNITDIAWIDPTQGQYASVSQLHTGTTMQPTTPEEVAAAVEQLLKTGLTSEVRMVTPEEIAGILEGNEQMQVVNLFGRDKTQQKIDYLRGIDIVKTDETRTDEDYDPDDAEYTQQKVYIPVYLSLWEYADNTNPDTEEFSDIDEALMDLQTPGDYSYIDSYFTPSKTIRLELKEAWIDKNGDIIEESDNLLNVDDTDDLPVEFKNKLSEYTNTYDSFGTIDTNTFEGREDSARELENKVYFDINKDIISEYDGYKVSSTNSGKYRNIYVEKGEESDVIQLRIADHSYNPNNNDLDARQGKFISIEIANVNPTEGRFHGRYGIQFDGSDTYEDVVEEVNDRIKEIIDNIISVQFFRTPTGTIYGFVKGGVVYLNSTTPNLNTPIHEFGHLWIDAIEGSELYNRGAELVKNTPYWERVNTDPNYKDLSETARTKEAMAMAIGDKGEAVKRDIGLFARIRTWINDVWKRIGAQFGIQNLTPAQIQNLTFNDFVEVAVSELMSESPLNPPQGDLKNQLPSTIDVDGTQRPTANSTGKPIHSTEEGIRNFWRWFGDSKVVDSEGRPLVVYHGTLSNFDTFDLNHTGKGTDSGVWGKGFYFSNDPKYSNTYAERKGISGSVMPVYLSIKNPLITNKDNQGPKIDVPNSTIEDLLNGPENYSRLFREKLIEQGNDGVIAYGDEFVVFDPNQIKSATGNDGSFDPNEPDIRFQVEPSKPEFTGGNVGKYATEIAAYNEAIAKIESQKKALKEQNLSPEALKVQTKTLNDKKFDLTTKRKRIEAGTSVPSDFPPLDSEEQTTVSVSNKPATHAEKLLIKRNNAKEYAMRKLEAIAHDTNAPIDLTLTALNTPENIAHNLQVAKTQAKAGTDSQTVLNNTGWKQTPSGQWEYEKYNMNESELPLYEKNFYEGLDAYVQKNGNAGTMSANVENYVNYINAQARQKAQDIESERINTQTEEQYGEYDADKEAEALSQAMGSIDELEQQERTQRQELQEKIGNNTDITFLMQQFSEARKKNGTQLTSKVKDVAQQISDYIRVAVGKDIVDVMSEREFKALINRLETATSAGSLRTAMKAVNQTIQQVVLRKNRAILKGFVDGKILNTFYLYELDAAVRTNNQITPEYANLIDNDLMNTLSNLNSYNRYFEIQGKNKQGVSIARNVDEGTRQVMQFVRDYKELSREQLATLETELNDERNNLNARNTDTLTDEVKDNIRRKLLANERKQIAIEQLKRLADIKDIEADIKVLKSTDFQDEAFKGPQTKWEVILDRQKELEAAQMKSIRDFASLLDTGRSLLTQWKEAEQKHKDELAAEAIAAVTDKSVKTQGQEKTNPTIKKKTLLKTWWDSPLTSMEFMLSNIDRNHPTGEGPMYRRWMTALTKASDKFYNRYNKFRADINTAAKEIMGMDLKAYTKDTRKDSGMAITYKLYDEAITGEAPATETIQMTKGELLYVWLTWQHTDGREKLEAMSITEGDIKKIAETLGEDYIAFARWTQNYLNETRETYNETHVRIFGTSMGKIKNYFPLKYPEKDLTPQGTVDEINPEMPSIFTGAIKNRVRTKKHIKLDENFLDTLMEHAEKMESWNAYAELRKDLNALIKNVNFKNQLEANSAGSFQDFQNAAKIAVDANQQSPTDVEQAFMRMVRRLQGAAIAGRINTAIKQSTAGAAYIFYNANPKYYTLLIKNLKDAVQVKKSIDWAKANLPTYAERVGLGNFGNEKILLDKWEDSLKAAGKDKRTGAVGRWIDNFTQEATRYGMIPNKWVDGYIFAVGSHAIYEYEKQRYLKAGMEETAAEQRALFDASNYSNKVSQSSNPAYLAPIQKSKTMWAQGFTAFMNASFAFGRNVTESAVQLSRAGKQVISLTAENQAAGMTPEAAKKQAQQQVLNANGKAVLKILYSGLIANVIFKMFDTALSALMGAGDDDDDITKKKMLDAAWQAPLNNTLGGSQIISVIEGFEPQGLLDGEISKAIRDLKKIVKEGFSVEIATTAAQYAMKIGLGLNVETVLNIYNGIEKGIIEEGGAVMAYQYITNVPKTVRKATAETIREGESLGDYAQRVALAYDRELKPAEISKLVAKKIFTDDGDLTRFNRAMEVAKEWDKLQDAEKELPEKSERYKELEQINNANNYILTRFKRYTTERAKMYRKMLELDKPVKQTQIQRDRENINGMLQRFEAISPEGE